MWLFVSGELRERIIDTRRARPHSGPMLTNGRGMLCGSVMILLHVVTGVRRPMLVRFRAAFSLHIVAFAVSRAEFRSGDELPVVQIRLVGVFLALGLQQPRLVRGRLRRKSSCRRKVELDLLRVNVSTCDSVTGCCGGW